MHLRVNDPRGGMYTYKCEDVDEKCVFRPSDRLQRRNSKPGDLERLARVDRRAGVRNALVQGDLLRGDLLNRGHELVREDSHSKEKIPPVGTKTTIPC